MRPYLLHGMSSPPHIIKADGKKRLSHGNLGLVQPPVEEVFNVGQAEFLLPCTP